MAHRKKKRIRPQETATPAVTSLPPPDFQSPIRLSFRHVTAGRNYCLSLCTQGEVRDAVDCLRMLTTMPWIEVLKSGGKGKNKAGLGYTPYPDSCLRKVTRPKGLSDEVKIAGVRMQQKGRIFGYYMKHVFHLLWFDRNHDIVPA